MKVTHIASWIADRGFFISLGFTKDEFHAITWFTSWAVDADHGSDLDETESDTKM